MLLRGICYRDDCQGELRPAKGCCRIRHKPKKMSNAAVRFVGKLVVLHV